MYRWSRYAGAALAVGSLAFCGMQAGFGQAHDSRVGGHFGFDGFGDGYGYHSSTAGEGYARGMGEVIRAYGENNLANARAQREWEAARKEYIDNRLLATEAFWERRQIYQQNRAAEQYEQRQRAEAYLAKVRLQDLSPQEFDLETGQIQWPKLLADERFQQFRTQLDQLFAKRAQYGELEVDDYSTAESLIKQWREDLTVQRDLFPDAVLRDSLRFLLRLNRELEHNYS